MNVDVRVAERVELRAVEARAAAHAQNSCALVVHEILHDLAAAHVAFVAGEYGIIDCLSIFIYLSIHLFICLSASPFAIDDIIVIFLRPARVELQHFLRRLSMQTRLQLLINGVNDVDGRHPGLLYIFVMLLAWGYGRVLEVLAGCCLSDL